MQKHKTTDNHPTQTLPPPLRTLRRSSELLSISYFLNIFGTILSIQDFSIRKLEADLDGNHPDSYAPTLIPKLLVALTGDRTTNYSNWESRLRREFLRREPHANPLGKEPAKTKSKLPKRAVGYVYITEPIIPPPTIPPHPSSSTTGQPPHHTPSQSDQLPNLPAEENHRPSSSDQAPPVPQSTTESTPSLQTPNPDQDQIITQPKPTPLESNENSSPVPQPSLEDGTGTTKTWSSLSPTVKLKALFKLCEWHFGTPHDLERFRRLVDLKSYSTGGFGPDDRFDWRQEPCGIDSAGHQYWLAGQGIEARLWIQRKEPQPPRKSITLRIPARVTKKKRGAPPKHQRQPRPPQAPTPTSLSTATTRGSSNPGSLASKRPRLTGTRSSTRLRATQIQPPTPATSAPPRPPTMIVIKKSSVSQRAETPRSIMQNAADRSSRPSPRRRRRNDDVWEDVPPGWLKEVVEPAPNHGSLSPAFSSDLSEMSEDDEDQPQSEHNMTTSNHSIPKNSKPISTQTNSNINDTSIMDDESLTELTESQDASTVVTCDSLPSDSNTSDSEMNQSQQRSRAPIENGTDDQTALNSGDDDVVMANSDNNLTVPDATTAETSRGLENQTNSEKEEKLETSHLPNENDQGIHPQKSTPSTNGSSLVSTTQAEKNSVSCSIDQQPSTLNPTEQPISKTLSESSPLTDDQNTAQSASDRASESLFPEMKGHPLDPNWIEWEVICSNLDEWEQFGQHFQKSVCQSEKKLGQFINREIIPELIAAYEAEEIRIQKEKEIAQRKRSTRQTIKETQSVNSVDSEITVREGTRMHSTRLEAKRLRELEMEEVKKQQKEEDQRLVRLKEREERIALREAQLAAERDAELKRAERARLRAESKLLGNAIKVARPGAENSVPSFDSDQQWKLNCEICGASGINMDDGSEVICCDVCEEWQHLSCHDKADEIMKRAKRDWSSCDFLCYSCSGSPIPRAVLKLKSKTKNKPRSSSTSTTSNKFGKNEINFWDPVSSSSYSPPLTNKSNKLSILMSNPNKLGATSLSQVYPNPDAVNQHDQVSGKIENGGMKSESRQVTDNYKINNSPITEFPANPIPIPIPPPTSNNGTVAVDLSIYYDDLEKLRLILKSNKQLQRNLPTEVMKKLRNYLIDQQQQSQRKDSGLKQDLDDQATRSLAVLSSCSDHHFGGHGGLVPPTTSTSMSTTTTSMGALASNSISISALNSSNDNTNLLVGLDPSLFIDPQLSQS